MATVLSLSGLETFAGLAPGFDFGSLGLGTRISRPHLGHATRRPAPASSITTCCWHWGQPKAISMNRASPSYRWQNASLELCVGQGLSKRAAAPVALRDR